MINKDGLLNLLIGGGIGPKRLVELSTRGLETTMMRVSFDATVVSHVWWDRSKNLSTQDGAK